MKSLNPGILRQRGTLLKAKYERGLQGIYGDLRKQARDRLDLLQRTHHYGILAVDQHQVHVDQPIQLAGASSWFLDDTPIQVHMVNEVVLGNRHTLRDWGCPCPAPDYFRC